jgi:hypothetical protein
MQRGTKAELQMLRELAWLIFPAIACPFCHKPLLVRHLDMTYGHRRHPPVTTKLTVHHRDHNRENNNPGLIVGGGNLAPCHRQCHINYHANLRRKDDPELDDVTDS